MKQLLITNDFPPMSGGIARYLYGLWSSLPSDEITVIAPKMEHGDQFDSEQKFKIVRMRYILQRLAILEEMSKVIVPLLYSFKILAKEHIKYIHCGHILTSGIVGLILNFMFKIPYCVYVYGADVTEYKSSLMISIIKMILLRSDRIITECSFMEDTLLGLGISGGKIYKIMVSIDTEKFNPDVECDDIKKQYDLENKKVILTVSRLVQRKGHDVVIQAMKRILQDIPEAIYLIVGTGLEEHRLRSLCRDCGVDKQVIFAGFVKDEHLGKYYNACDIFVLANRDIDGDVEGAAIVFLEAFACRKPVIGGRSGGTTECVLDNYNGILVDPLDISAIAQKIIECLKNAHYRNALGANGRAMIEQHFTKEKVAEKFNSIFENKRVVTESTEGISKR